MNCRLKGVAHASASWCRSGRQRIMGDAVRIGP